MHDIRAIRENPEAFDRDLARRGLAPLSAALIALDEARKGAVSAAQANQERRNALAKEIGGAKKARDEARAASLMAEVAALKGAEPGLKAAQEAADRALADHLAAIPNRPDPEVPEGADEHGNVRYRSHASARERLGEGREHFELGEAFSLMDFEAAAKLSGSRFVVLKGQLARLERALGQFMLDLHTQEHGYLEVAPPILVKDEAMFGTAQLPKFRNDQFSVRSGFDTLDPTTDAIVPSTGGSMIFGGNVVMQTRWLIPTAEVPLTNLVRESILVEGELPLRFAALTPCFRAEAGAAGRDTRGMLRQHQFNKVELVSITTPERSADEHERMLTCAEAVLKKLDLPYRVMTLCAGDMGFASQKTYDIEVWVPGQRTYREISSCSVCGDFQARRMNARYRGKDGKPAYVHTLNGSGVAVGRALIAVMENYQNPDGSIAIPSVLQPYMGGMNRIEGGGPLMRILVTNDDGIHAPGLATLEEIAGAISDDVWVVAPESDQSGVSHSLSLNDPLRLRQVSEKRFAVKGTPSDCVILGVRHILAEHGPDLVLSGVNRGQNVAEDVTYSGTIAAAMEGTILGVRAIALSQAYGAGGRGNLKWNCARHHGPGVIEKILDTGIEPGILVNVNFPDCEPEDVRGIAVAAQGFRNQALLSIDARVDGRGNPYFWLAFAKARFEPGNGSDLKAIAEKRISVTPLRLDLTDEPTLTRFAQAFAD